MKAESLGRKQGSSILEVLIALSVLTLGIAASAMLTFANQTLKLDSDTANVALYKDKDFLEEARARSREDFDSLLPIAPVLDPDPDNNNFKYTKELVVIDVTPCRKETISRITYSADPKRPQKIELKTDFTDVAGALALGGDCAIDPPESNWDNPQKFASDNFNPGKPKSIDVLNRIVYMGSDKVPFLHIADTTHAVLGQSNGLFVTFSNGFNASSQINAVDAATWRDPLDGTIHTYVYAAMDTNANQLKVIDVTDIQNPVLVATRSLSACVTGSYPEGWRVYYYKNRLYFVTRETAGPEFHIFDVSTPSNPVELGGGACKGTQLNTTVNSLAVRDQIVGGVTKRFAYLATTENDGELQVYDVTDPLDAGAISEVAAARQNLSGAQDGQSIYLVGYKLYFGRQSTPGGPDLYIYNSLDPTTGLPLLGSKDINTGVIALRVAGKFAFVGTPKTNAEFQVWNISNPENIEFINTYNFPNIIENGIDYEPDFVYSTSSANDSLRIIYSP